MNKNVPIPEYIRIKNGRVHPKYKCYVFRFFATLAACLNKVKLVNYRKFI